jgi:hypothetical protein
VDCCEACPAACFTRQVELVLVELGEDGCSRTKCSAGWAQVRHSLAQHRPVAAAVSESVLPVAAADPCNTARWCAGAALCAQEPRYCSPQHTAGRRPEPWLSTCHEQHPEIPAAEVRSETLVLWEFSGRFLLSLTALTGRCTAMGGRTAAAVLVCDAAAGLSVVTSCRLQLCWAAAWWHTRCVLDCMQDLQEFEASSSKHLQAASLW